HGVDERALVGEVGVDRALGEPGCFGDIVERCGFHSTERKPSRRGGDDGLPCLRLAGLLSEPGARHASILLLRYRTVCRYYTVYKLVALEWSRDSAGETKREVHMPSATALDLPPLGQRYAPGGHP